MKRVLMALIVLGLACAPSFGAQIFLDNFDSLAGGYGLTAAFNGWQVLGGNIDVIVTGSGEEWLCNGGVGACLDTDGTSFDIPPNSAMTISQEFAGLAQGTYIISFRLGGSARNDTNTIEVSFGGVTNSFTLASGDPHAVYSFAVNFAGGDTALVFSHKSGSDNSGLLLDDVSVATQEGIPEPGTLTMVAAGALLLLLRRRR